MTSFFVRTKLTPRDPTDTAVVQAVDCPVCHGFTQPNLIQLHELVKSCQSCAGCYFFQGLLIVLTRAGFDVPIDSSTPLFLSSWSLWGTEHFLTVARCELQEFMHWQAPTILDEAEHFEIFALPGDNCPWPKVPIAKLTSGDTSSLACINQLRAHLTQCMREHKSCSSREHVELPTRVLEISDAEGDELKIRLKATNGEVDRYICLSHRWLEGKTLTTTTSTISARIAGIPWTDLPKVFQEAITVTYKLGFRYIWIDSLTINQDKSSGDWLREAPKMAQYYQNSSLTISAAESAESLFYRFPDEAQVAWNVQPPERFQQSGYKVRLRKPLPHDVSALHQRGWVYQEHVLSPRIAHFGKELIWECAELTSCECGRLPLPTASGNSVLRDAWDIGNVVSAYGRKQGHALALTSEEPKGGYCLVPRPVFIQPDPDSDPASLTISHWLLEQQYMGPKEEYDESPKEGAASSQEAMDRDVMDFRSNDPILLQTGGVYQKESENTLAPNPVVRRRDRIKSMASGLIPRVNALGRKKIDHQEEDAGEKQPKRFADPPIRLVHCRWLDIIAHYSRRTLTYRSDIFPALAGLTKQFQPYYNGEYCAGLWKEALGVGLLWRACDPKGHPKPVEWYAPSWSWASTTSPVDYHHLLTAFELTSHTFRYSVSDVFIEGAKFNCEPLDGRDTTMSLKSAKLTISGPLFQLVYGPILDEPEKDDDAPEKWTAEQIESMKGQMEQTICFPDITVAESDIRYFPLARYMNRHEETSWLAQGTGLSFVIKRDKKRELRQALDLWWDNKEDAEAEILAAKKQTVYDCLLVARHESQMDSAYYALLLEETGEAQTYRRKGLVRLVQGAMLDVDRLTTITLV